MEGILLLLILFSTLLSFTRPDEVVVVVLWDAGTCFWYCDHLGGELFAVIGTTPPPNIRSQVEDSPVSSVDRLVGLRTEHSPKEKVALGGAVHAVTTGWVLWSVSTLPSANQGTVG